MSRAFDCGGDGIEPGANPSPVHQPVDTMSGHGVSGAMRILSMVITPEDLDRLDTQAEKEGLSDLLVADLVSMILSCDDLECEHRD